jgi:hypothetical protein
VIELEARAVVMNDGSENQTPGSSLRQASEETPPSAIGISTDSPVRLSVTVIDSATAPPHWVGQKATPVMLAPPRDH